MDPNTLDKTLETVIGHTLRIGVIAAAVLSPKQVLLDPHLRERGFFDVIEQPGVGKKPIPKQLGAHFSAFSIDCEAPAPMLDGQGANLDRQ